MKKVLFAFVATLMLATVSFAGENPTNATSVQKMTLKELLEKYDGNVKFEDGTSLADLDLNTLIVFGQSANPCDGIGEPCGGALAQAQAAARALANDCCCVITAGVECCDQGTLMAILFIMTPTHC